VLGVKSRTDALKGYVQRVTDPNIPGQIASDLFKFGAIMTCGTVERCVEVIILERLSKKAHPKVLSFIKSHFKKGTNYDCEAILELLGRFDEKWRSELEAYLIQNPSLGASLTSCYAVRNPIAHGASASLGGARLKKISDDAILLIEALEIVTA